MWVIVLLLTRILVISKKKQAMASQEPIQLEPWCSFEGKVVLVTGASSGLGREFCVDLVKAGCRVVAAARRLDRLKSLCDELNQTSSSSDCQARAMAIELDVTANGPTIEGAVNRAWEAFGRIDALINNAGVRGSVTMSVDLSEEEWNNTFKTNVTGAWLISKYVSKRMREADLGGSIINVSSINGLSRVYTAGGIAYSSSKAALHVVTKIMAMELGKYNIRVNAVAPGLFPSEITEGLLRKNWLKNVAKRTVPLQTFGETDPALTSVIKYLLHDSSNYVSGNIYVVDAGYTLPGVPIFSSL